MKPAPPDPIGDPVQPVGLWNIANELTMLRLLLVPVFAEGCPLLSTADIRFATAKPIYETTKSHVSHVVLDEKWDKTWDESAPCYLEESPNVLAYGKNDQPHFGISYEWNGETRQYVPDYLIKIAGATWIVEIEWQRIPTGDDDARWKATAKWVGLVIITSAPRTPLKLWLSFTKSPCSCFRFCFIRGSPSRSRDSRLMSRRLMRIFDR